MFTLAEIGERIQTQDNRITSHPIFLVEEKRRVWGIDPTYSDDVLIAWLNADGDEPSPRLAAALERNYQDGCRSRGKYRRVGYIEIWVFVQACFTEAAANRYIAENRHNLKSPRVYVASGYRNFEWIAIRAMLAAQAPVKRGGKSGGELSTPTPCESSSGGNS